MNKKTTQLKSAVADLLNIVKQIDVCLFCRHCVSEDDSHSCDRTEEYVEEYQHCDIGEFVFNYETFTVITSEKWRLLHEFADKDE